MPRLMWGAPRQGERYPPVTERLSCCYPKSLRQRVRFLHERSEAWAPETLSAPLGGGVGVLNLGLPWWLMAAVVVVFAALLWYVLGGWERPWVVAPLVFVLAPVCTLAALVVAMALSLVLTEPLESPPPARTERTDLRATPEPTGPASEATRYARPASPTASPSPSATPSASPSASLSASPGARTPP